MTTVLQDQGIRVAINQTLARTTPSTSFGDKVKHGLNPGGASNSVAETLWQLAAGLGDIQMHVRMHSPANLALLADLDVLKTRLQAVAVRAAQTPAANVGTGSRFPRP